MYGFSDPSVMSLCHVVVSRGMAKVTLVHDRLVADGSKRRTFHKLCSKVSEFLTKYITTSLFF